MKKIILFLVLNFFSDVSFGQKKKVENRIDSLMKAANQIGVFNGNILVLKDAEIVYKAEIGYADSTKTKLLNSENCFAIGSISKEFNGVGMMILKEKGKLNLTDKISKYLPQLPQWAEKIQIKHLLQYTSGLPMTKAETDADYFKAFANLQKLAFEPGTSYIYSNDNVFLQKKIIEKITALTYNEFLKKYIFKPSKMTGIVIDTSTTNKNIAHSFDNDYNKTTNYQGKNDIYLTINDLKQWVEAISSYKIISKAATIELAENFGGQSSLGETIFENGLLKLYSHQGSGNNYEALLYKENNITILLLTNNHNFKLFQLKDAILNILNDKPYSVPKKSIYLDIRKKLLDDFMHGMAFYRGIKLQKNKYDFDAELADLVNTGKYLMRRNRFDDAIKIFHLGAMTDLKDWKSNFYQLIGDCYLKTENRNMAIFYYEKALELDKTNKTVDGILKEILNQK